MSGAPDSPAPPARMRLDKWLWAARFFKTRSLAGREARAGHIRLNGRHVAKASATITAGDVLTFPKARRILVVRVLALSDRRGPSETARSLYEDMTPPEETPSSPAAADPGARPRGSGRPTKAERRALDRLRDRA